MKPLALLLFLLAAGKAPFAQTLLTYGNKKASVTDFSNFVAANALDTAKREKQIELFINYLLKLQAAKDAGLDSTSRFQRDVEDYTAYLKSQLLYDELTLDSLTHEAMERAKTDIEIKAWFYPTGISGEEDAKGAAALYNALQQGRYDSAASVRKNFVGIEEIYGGYITAFSLPYSFENRLYSLKAGQFVRPVKTEKGWLILQKVSSRKAAGELTIAQIFFNRGVNLVEDDSIRAVAEGVRSQVLAGAPFEEMAKKYSHQTYKNGYRPLPFYPGTYSPAFEEQAYSLSADGDVSPCFTSEYGFHILQRISVKPVPSQGDASFFAETKQRVLADSRAEIARDAFVTTAIKRTGAKVHLPDTNTFWEVTDSAIISRKVVDKEGINGMTPLISFKNGYQSTLNDWIDFAGLHVAKTEKLHNQYRHLFDEFVKSQAQQQYRLHAIELNSYFQKKIEEYYEGSLVFALMEKEVWQKAQDNQELKQYYLANKSKYKWGKSAEAILFTCNSREICSKIREKIIQNNSWRGIMEENSPLVTTDSGRFEITVPALQKIKRTGASAIEGVEGRWHFTYIKHFYQAGDTKDFEHAKESVSADLNQQLQRSLQENLRKKYPISLNETLLNTL